MKTLAEIQKGIYYVNGEKIIPVADDPNKYSCNDCALCNHHGACEEINRKNYLPGCTSVDVLFHWEYNGV